MDIRDIFNGDGADIPIPPLTNKSELTKYLKGFRSKLDLSVRDRVHKVATDAWSDTRHDILMYFATALQEMPEHRDKSVSELIERIDSSSKRRGRPPKRVNPWRFS